MNASQRNRMLVFSLSIILLAGCTAGAASFPGASASAATKTRRPSDTPAGPPTETPTATAIPTAAPFVTPSPGPAPDLELFNVTVREGNAYWWAGSKEYNRVEYLFAEMRNNTDYEMIFPGRENGLRMNLERWWLHVAGIYMHDVLGAFIRPGTDYQKAMSCVLYPGETGVLVVSINSLYGDSSNDYSSSELSVPPNQLGYQLNGYQGFYKRWEEIEGFYPFREHPDNFYANYHPQVENLEYLIEGEEIVIDYDVDYIVPDYLHDHDSHSWIVLYDNDGEILNILNYKTPTCTTMFCDPTGYKHLRGVGSNEDPTGGKWDKSDSFTQWWRPAIKLNEQDLMQVDHIRVLFEIQRRFMCQELIGYE
ncbi:MAG: hypothetical protein JW748_03240 [Anaerolineales bacterium]|nr:hypothetical protein [Anaerolineales bacterium]